MKNLVSVIVPTYNRSFLLLECITSIYNQSHRPIEVLIVDDGSSDDTNEIVLECIERFKNNDFNILFFKQSNKGAPAARNLGFTKSNGMFIQFLDSDDILLPNKLKTEINYLDKYDLVYSKAQFVKENLTPIENTFWGEALSGTYLDYFKFSWQTMCALYKRETILKGGLWAEELSINQDWEFSIRYILLNFKILFIDEIHSLFRVHEQGNIGMLDSIHKIKGKELSTIKIREGVRSKGLIEDALEELYLRRLIFCVLAYGSIQATSSKKELLNYIQDTFCLSIKEKILLYILQHLTHFIDRLVLKVYMKLN